MANSDSAILKVTDEKVESYAEATHNNIVNYIIHMTKKDITYDFMMSTFGSFNGKVKCHIYELMEVPIGAFSYTEIKSKKEHHNTNKFVTTVGRFIYNIIIRDFGFSELFDGFYNDTLTSGHLKDVEQRLSYALIEDDITTTALKEWENTMQWFMPFEDTLSPNHTEKMISCTRMINKKKAELLKEHKAEIDAGNIKVASEIENELLDYAKEYLGDDPCMDTILSNAGGDFKNNFKNMYVMKGAIKNPDPNAKQQYDIVTGNYMDGISADEYSIIAGSGTQGAYFRGKKTADGGYWEQLLISAYQHIRLDPKGSDCGTDKYIVVTFDKKNIHDYMYSYAIKSNGSLERIDSHNYKSYIGKTVKLRFASMCKSKTGICNMCAGDLLYVTAPTGNIGVAMSNIPDRLKNISMKSFHDSTVQLATIGEDIDIDEMFYPFEK